MLAWIVAWLPNETRDASSEPIWVSLEESESSVLSHKRNSTKSPMLKPEVEERSESVKLRLLTVVAASPVRLTLSRRTSLPGLTESIRDRPRVSLGAMARMR